MSEGSFTAHELNCSFHLGSRSQRTNSLSTNRPSFAAANLVVTRWSKELETDMYIPQGNRRPVDFWLSCYEVGFYILLTASHVLHGTNNLSVNQTGIFTRHFV